MLRLHELLNALKSERVIGNPDGDLCDRYRPLRLSLSSQVVDASTQSVGSSYERWQDFRTGETLYRPRDSLEDIS